MPVVLTLLILWPIAELFVAIRIGESIGALLTIVLLLASWPVGTWALRSQGRAAWRRLGDAIAAGRPPGREVLDGALVLIGGVLLIIPGFISDVFGIALLLPPTRAPVRALAGRHLQSRWVVRAAGFGRPARSYDVDSTARDIDQPRLRP